MSTLTQITEFLEQTRNLPVGELNRLIAKLDQSAEPQISQGFAHSILGYMKMNEIAGEVATFAEGRAKAASLRDRHSWLFVEPIIEDPAPMIEEFVASPKAMKVKTEKKSEIAKRIYAGLADKSKANVMKVFQEQLDTSVAGSQTFYYVVAGPTGAKRGRKANPDATPKVAYVRKTVAGAPTKRELAAKLFASAPDKSRAAIVARFQSELGLSPACSTTYFYTVGGAHVRATK